MFKYGISWKRVGKSYVGLCPFHNEKRPSLHLYKKSEQFHCFGCGQSGSAEYLNHMAKKANIQKRATMLENIRLCKLRDAADADIKENLDEMYARGEIQEIPPWVSAEGESDLPF